MSVIGVGTDLVDVARFELLIERAGRRFLDRWFRAPEVAYCLAQNEPARHAAARFAAKEAVLKSLRRPHRGPPPWREIEIVRSNDGLPSVRLHGTVRSIAGAAGIAALHVSMSHDTRYATATVVAVGEDSITHLYSDAE